MIPVRKRWQMQVWRWDHRRIDARRRRRAPLDTNEDTAFVVPRVEVPAPAPGATTRVGNDLQRAIDRVRRGEELIEKQRDLIFQLRRNGKSSEDAEGLLRTFMDVVQEFRVHMTMLQIQERKGLR